MKNKKLIAIDLLKEELEELESKEIPLHSYIPTRIEILKEAIQELKNIQSLVQLKDMSIRTHEKEINRLLGELYNKNKVDCISCRYNRNQKELSGLNEEEYLQTFEKCRTCSNYHTTNFEEK